MALRARTSRLPADPLLLGAAAARRRGAAVLSSADGSGPSFVTCDPVETSRAFDPEPTRELSAELGEWGAVPRWIGVLPYEACRFLERSHWTRPREDRPSPQLSLPCWQRYPAVARVADGEVWLVGESESDLDRLEQALGSEARGREAWLQVRPQEQGELHAARIRRALDLIGQGQLYQVNLARRFEYDCVGDPLSLFGALAEASGAPFAAALRLGGVDVCASSPELFLSLTADRRLLTEPIKGTRPRSDDPAEDARLAQELEADPKERAELAMILDVERNDLGRISETGSVRLVRGPEVVSHPTIHHRQALLEARLRPEVSRAALLRSMLPSGSVTGAPKVRAMEVIACLEPQRRGLYTGAYGYSSHDGGLTLAMAIRVLTVQSGVAHYHSGGGIVADSDPLREVEETEWKARQLNQLLRVERSPEAQPSKRPGLQLTR